MGTQKRMIGCILKQSLRRRALVGVTTVAVSGLGAVGSAVAEDVPGFVIESQKIVEAGYKGDLQPPPMTGPAAVRGKKVWYISCGQAYVACVQLANGFVEAGKALGWEVTIQDGKATPNVAADIIRQAVAARIDGVAVSYFDCPGIKSALLQAKQGGMPVAALGSLDCSDPVFGGQEPLFTATLNIFGSKNAGDFYYKMG